MSGNWDGIDEFVAVEAAGSFAKAARALGLSTSHVSRALVRLEERLGARLFYRTTRSVILTDAGRSLIEQFRRVVAEREQAFAMAGDGGEPQGLLRLTCSPAMGERFVVPIVRRFAQIYPRLSVDIDLSNRVIDLLAEGFDIAIRTGELNDPRLARAHIASRRYYVCASPGYLAAHGRPLRVAELEAHECLMATAPAWHFQVENQAVSLRLSGRFHCNSGWAVLEAALADMGLCQLPGFYVLPHIQAGRLVPVLETYAAADEPIWAVHPKHGHRQPKISKLLPMLQTGLRGAAL